MTVECIEQLRVQKKEKGRKRLLEKILQKISTRGHFLVGLGEEEGMEILQSSHPHFRQYPTPALDLLISCPPPIPYAKATNLTTTSPYYEVGPLAPTT